MNTQQYEYLKNQAAVQAMACTAQTREDYLAWRKQWKEDYRALSAYYRYRHLDYRASISNIRPEKKARLQAQLASIQPKLVQAGCLVCSKYPARNDVINGCYCHICAATVMLAVLKLSKEHAHRAWIARRAQTVSAA